MLKRSMTTITLSALMLSPVLAQSRQSDPITPMQLAQRALPVLSKDANRNAKLTDVASIIEDLIGFSLEGKADKVAEKVAATRKALTTLRPILTVSIFAILGSELTEMEQASSKSDIFGAALAAVEAYRVLENAMDPARRPSPIEVAMLDYSGFKLSILAAAQSTGWATIGATAKNSDVAWSSLDARVKDASIRNLVKSIQDGLRDAVERKDIHGVKFAAKMQLEVVDVLEQYFTRGAIAGGTVRR